MAKSVLRKIGWTAVVLVGLLMAAFAAAPYLIDVEAYKPALIEAVKDATGRELVIDGPMKLSMFPQPRISARQVHFANAAGAEGAQMIDVRWVGASPSWWALLQGRVEIGRLTLYQPSLVLETDADGVPNWRFNPGAGADQPQGAPAAGLHLAVGRLRIVQGTLSYTNPRTKQTLRAQDVDATASVGSLQGPFSISGTATVNGVPLSLDVSVGAAGPGGHEASFGLQVSSGKLDFKGTVSAFDDKAEVKGHLAVMTGVLTDFIGTVVRATGQPVPQFDSVVGDFVFDGDIDYSPTRLAISDFRMSLGGETASGTLALGAGKAPSLAGHVSLPKVDVERWLALLATPGAFAGPASAPPATPAGAAAKPPTAAPSPMALPAALDVSLSLDVAEVLYRKGTVRDLAIAVEMHNGVITVPQLKAVLPGDMVLQAHAAAPEPSVAPATKALANAVQASGEISLVGPRLRDMLGWLGIDTSGVPAGKLQKLDLEGKLASTANGAAITDLAVDLDGQHATGSGSVTYAVPVTTTTTLQLDRFDLDAYMPVAPAALPGDAAAAPKSTPGAAPASAPPAQPAPSDKTLPVFGLKTKVGKLVFRKETLGGVEGDISMQGNLLTLNSVKVADLLGARIDLKGSVTDFGTAPRFDLAFNATMPDADRVIDYAGLPKFANGKLGAASASGSVAGTLEAVTLRNATATLQGSTLNATGTLALGRDFRFDFPAFTLQSPDVSPLLAVATGRPQSGAGPLSASGTFKGDGQRAAFDGSLTAVGTPMNGHLETTLGKRPSITANLRVPGTLDIDHWLGVSAAPLPAVAPVAAAPAAPTAVAPAVPLPASRPRVATSKPVDLSALRAFDATLTLETSAVAVASVEVTYADMQASLQNGVFRIGKLTGQFYGGAVDFNGTIDATGQALALDLGGSLQGIYLGVMLRDTAGTNTFGNEHLMVTVDGKINVMDIRLSGGGASAEQIRNTLRGSGQVSGYVYPAVTGGSLGFASFATGLGSLFSTEMGFNSAVLSSFINRQSTIAGQFLLSDGTVSLQNQTVQGQNAIATITSRTDLASGTTDTTISLDTGKRGPADYIVTLKGPVSSPTMTTRSGPGN